MFCSTCGTANEPGSDTCVGCDAPLATICGSCATHLAPEARFCHGCGAKAEAAPAAATAVRKHVTALFADLVGSTAFAERVDPEVARTTLATYHDLIRSVIESHHGTVLKFMGDGAVALFGVPDVAEDDATRAVAAGLDLQRQFVSIAAQVDDQHGTKLGLRVGVNTGELVISAGDADIVGDVLNTAARLEAACLPGHVLVGEDTWRATRADIRYEALGEVAVKGKTEPIPTYQAVVVTGRPEEAATPFVGRDQELRAMHSAHAEAVDRRAVRLVSVIGSPGVGKTRLAYEFAQDSGALTFDLRFERQGSTTFAPIGELVRSVTEGGSDERLRELVADQPDADRLAPVLATLIGSGDARTTDETFWAIRRLFEVLAATQPVVTVFDDIQWAEPLFWDLLEHLVEWVVAPVSIIALARPELRSLRPSLVGDSPFLAAAIALDGLDADTTRRLAERILGGAMVPDELLALLPRSTQGNPLFVREFIRMLIDDGVLAHDGEQWRLTIGIDDVDVPPTIVSLLATRIERLPADERRVLELASVIGTEFDQSTLTAIAGEATAKFTANVLERLRHKDLVVEVGPNAHRFHHVLLRDAAYRRVLKSERARLHVGVGEHMQSQGVTLAGDRHVATAHHFEQAYLYDAELGSIDDGSRELARRAAEQILLAGEGALRQDDPAAAATLALRALRLPDLPASQQFDLLLLRCEALLAGDDVPQAPAAIDQLNALVSDDRGAALVDSFHAKLWALTDVTRLADAADLASTAAARLTEAADDRGTAYARLVRATCLARLGRMGDSENELDLAIGVARSAGDHRRTVEVLGAAPDAAVWGPGTIARAGGRCLDVLRLQESTAPSSLVEASALRCQGVLEALRDDRDASRRKFHQAKAMTTDLGAPHATYETLLYAGFCDLLFDDPESASAHLREAYDGFIDLGIRADAGEAAALLGSALLQLGDVETADELAALAGSASGQNIQAAMTAQWVTADIRSEQGRHDDAERCITAAIELAERSDLTIDHALVLAAGARVAICAGDLELGAARTEDCRRLLGAKGVTLTIGGITPPPPSTQTGAASTSTAAPLVNEAAAALHRLVDALAAGTAVLAEQLTDDLADPSGLIAVLQPNTDDDFELEILAVRDHNLCVGELVGRPEDRSANRYVWVRTDEGRIAAAQIFEEPLAALSHLDERWVAQGGPAQHATFDIKLRRAFMTSDWPALGALLTPEWESIDHQLIGPGNQDADGWTAGFDVEATGPSNGTLVYQAAYLAHHGPLALVDTRVWTARRDARWEQIVIRVNRSHQSTRLETFVPSAIDRAAERFDEMIDSHGRSTEPPHANMAWFYLLGELDHANESAELVAVRDTSLCLARVQRLGGPGVYRVFESNDLDHDHDHEHVDHAAEELDAAFDDLNQRWCRRGGSHVLTSIERRLRAAMTHGDAELLRPMFHPEFVADDHRALGMGERNADEYLTSIAPLLGNISMVTTACLRHAERTSLVQTRFVISDGSVLEALMFAVHADDQLLRYEMFAPEAVDDAVARFERVTAELAAG